MTEYKAAAPFAFSAGPRNAKLAFVGEAWGQEEERIGMPFVGQAGQELTRLLKDAGLQRSECFFTNVLALRPPDNKLDALCTSKKDCLHDLPPLSQGKYLSASLLPEIERLFAELREVSPNLIVPLGNTACWALLGSGKIGTIRGVVTQIPRLEIKALPTYHPSAVLRNWEFRTIVVADLMKAKREAEFSEIRRLKRFVLVDPSLEEINKWIGYYVYKADAIAVDIETTNGQIDCIGFAVSPCQAMVIPFGDARFSDANYWKTEEDELQAWQYVRLIMESDIPKIFQNGLYDLQYIPRLKITPKACYEDSMLLHHALYPELKKGLGFLGSIYTNEASWKLMRSRGEDTLKKDE